MWRKGNPCVLLAGVQIGAATMENSMAVPQKIKNRTTIWSAMPLLGIYPKEQNQYFKKISAAPCSLEQYIVH